MTKTDWLLMVLALVVAWTCLMAVVSAVAPKDEITINPRCDYTPQVWQISACNGLNVCDENFVRMTVEEANGVCR